MEECLTSVFSCEYPNLELIVVDDASSDQSVQMIHKVLEKYHNSANIVSIRKMLLKHNVGNCKAFNLALAEAGGKYIMDLATDDVLLPHGLTQQIKYLESQSGPTGFCYADAILIDEHGNNLGRFFDVNKSSLPQGNIYNQIIDGNFICPPTVVFNAQFLKEAGGYDENLSFEDLDIWLRLARKYNVAAYHATVVKWRRHNQSLSYKKYSINAEKHLKSILILLNKLDQLNTSQADWQATAKLCAYYLRFAVYTNNKHSARALYLFLENRQLHKYLDKFFYHIIPLSGVVAQLYKFYLSKKRGIKY